MGAAMTGRPAPLDPWEVITQYDDNPTHLARLEHKGRSAWSRRTALKYAADYQARHGRPAFAQRVYA